MSFTCYDNNETSTSKFWLFSNKKTKIRKLNFSKKFNPKKIEKKQLIFSVDLLCNLLCKSAKNLTHMRGGPREAESVIKKPRPIKKK